MVWAPVRACLLLSLLLPTIRHYLDSFSNLRLSRSFYGTRRHFRMSPSKFKPRRSTRKGRGQYPSANLHCPYNLSNKKGRRIPRVTASELNSDLLLEIFDWYRLYNTTTGNQYRDRVLGWNNERWWYKPIQVCRKWRHLILTSPNRLDLHLVCTYGTPVEDMLSHSPPLPLIIHYPAFSDKISAADEESIIHALQQPDRVLRIYVTPPTMVLCNLFKAINF